MFSVIFPGQGSQIVAMGKEFYDKHDLVKTLFREADEVLGVPISKIILEGPKDELDLTVNTQPAIFLISFSIFQVIKKEFNIDLHKAKYFAGHSLGEYSAIACANYLGFQETIQILKRRGDAMQNSVSKGEGGMLAVLGTNIENIEKILNENKNNFVAEIANDNSDGQIVLSGKNIDLNKLIEVLKLNNIKNMKLPVSAPFHSSLMHPATIIMEGAIANVKMREPSVPLISNVTATKVTSVEELEKLLIKQICGRVRWRESILNLKNYGVEQIYEIGFGKALSGMIKRIDTKKNVF